jgi:hypothetical protein
MGMAAARAAEPAGLEEIRSALQRQQEKIRSLHVRVRRKTTISVEREVLLGWPHEVPLPEYRGTEESLFAFRGDQRYHRVVAFDHALLKDPGYGPTALGEPSAETPKWLLPYLGEREVCPVDDAAACSEETFFQRNRDLGSFENKFQYSSAPRDEVHDSLPPSEYLMNVGLAVPDPTGRDEAQRNLHQMGLLPRALERWPYVISEKSERVEGAPCAALEAAMQCRLPDGDGSHEKAVRDKLWLDREHGLAIRKRETWVNGQLRRVVNSDFAEVLPGFWLPRQSRTETFAPPAAPEKLRDHAVCICDMTLALWVVNQTPDDLFDTALAEADPRPPGNLLLGSRYRAPPLHLTPAYHYRRLPWEDIGKAPGEAGGEETWAVRGIGWRRELRDGSKLQRLSVDTGRWAFSWRPADNRVTAHPSLGDRTLSPLLPIDRASIIRSMEEITGVFACKKDRLRGNEVDKLTVYSPAIRHPDGRWGNAHTAAEAKRAASGTEFCARHFWFDPKTNLWLQRDCGCKPLGYREILDYPPPESVPRELFEFEVPPGALLEVDDPALGRPVRSEGQTEPDAPQ